MKFIIIAILCLNVCIANDEQKALSHTQKALLAYPEIKRMKKETEKFLLDYIPLDREHVVVIGSVGISAIRGKVETKPIKNLNMKFIGVKARPDVYYDFRNNDVGMLITMSWSF